MRDKFLYPPDIFNVEDACRQMGGISRQTLYNLMNSGELRSIDVGGRRMIPAISIKRFIERKLETSIVPAKANLKRSGP